MSTVLVETRNLSKDYANSGRVLSDVNIRVEEREFVTVVGRSGSGKSTLMNIIGCLDRPTSGDVILDGTAVNYADTSELVHIRRNVVGFVFQQYNLIPNLNALENVEYPLLFRYTPKAERKVRAHKLLEEVGLADQASHYPGELSGGQQQRVAIARALINHPRLILADEPTGNLDSATAEQILYLMKELNRTQGTTFVMVTHEREFSSFSDKVILLKDGKVAD